MRNLLHCKLSINWYNYAGKHWHHLLKLNTYIYSDIPNRNECSRTPKEMHKNVQNSVTHKSQNLGVDQVNKLQFICTMEFYTTVKKNEVSICNNLVGYHKHNVECKRPVMREYTLYNFLYIKCSSRPQETDQCKLWAERSRQ